MFQAFVVVLGLQLWLQRLGHVSIYKQLRSKERKGEASMETATAIEGQMCGMPRGASGKHSENVLTHQLAAKDLIHR